MSCPIFVKFISRHFMVFEAIASGIITLFLIVNLIQININNIYIQSDTYLCLVSCYPAKLISSSSFFVSSAGLSTFNIMYTIKDFHSFLSKMNAFLPLALLHWLAFLVQWWIKVLKGNIFALFLILRGNTFSLSPLSVLAGFLYLSFIRLKNILF